MENKSSFQFNGYKVNKSIIEIKDASAEKLTVNFEPSGVLKNESNIFLLQLQVNVFDEEKNINIEVDITGEFKFKRDDDNLENFLYLNAPAILFPYIRSYITALTALSGVPPITLPTMNLSGLSEKLSENVEHK